MGDSTKVLDVGDIGELAVKGPQVMLGYWNNMAETENVFTKDGWLLTGDIAKMDADGYFYIVDRKKDMIDVSGLKVYPREVEELLFTHPAVKEAAVVGMPRLYRGEAVHAYVVLKPESKGKVTEGDIIQFAGPAWRHTRPRGRSRSSTSSRRRLIGKVLRRRLRENGSDAGWPGSGESGVPASRRSMTIASAFPPPRQSVARPRFLPVLFSSYSQRRQISSPRCIRWDARARPRLRLR